MKTIVVVFVTVVSFLLMNFLKAQTAAADNKLSETITFRPIPKGPSVYGVFEGRPPCLETAIQLKIPIPDDCVKLKWRLVFYQDSVTLKPSAFTLVIVGGTELIEENGGSYQGRFLQGKWTIAKGLKADPNAEIYSLEFDSPKVRIYLLKGDENVLFVLNENKEFRIGNEDFSYTLNRVKLMAGTK
jgi:hypothetical protein